MFVLRDAGLVSALWQSVLSAYAWRGHDSSQSVPGTSHIQMTGRLRVLFEHDQQGGGSVQALLHIGHMRMAFCLRVHSACGYRDGFAAHLLPDR